MKNNNTISIFKNIQMKNDIKDIIDKFDYETEEFDFEANKANIHPLLQVIVNILDTYIYILKTIKNKIMSNEYK